jgi:hypothetical protein
MTRYKVTVETEEMGQSEVPSYSTVRDVQGLAPSTALMSILDPQACPTPAPPARV